MHMHKRLQHVNSLPTEKIPPLSTHYHNHVNAVIYVVDSNDNERMEEAAEELQTMLNQPELHAAQLLVYANKQDLPRALTTAQVIIMLSIIKYHNITFSSS